MRERKKEKEGENQNTHFKKKERRQIDGGKKEANKKTGLEIGHSSERDLADKGRS